MAPDRHTAATKTFRELRDYLLVHRENYETAYREFRWPELSRFNYATDWFDVLAEEQADATALRIIEQDESEVKQTFAELSVLSQRFAGTLADAGVGRGDRVLLLLGNVAPLWVAMLACTRIGAVMIPATPLLSTADLTDRLDRGQVKALITGAGDTERLTESTGSLVRFSVGDVEGWLSYADAIGSDRRLLAGGDTAATDPLLLYFTSGTTAQPKLVEHSQVSYPVGHLSTMYWIGLQAGDRHLNISSPGWAKHAWSCLYAPWNAGATVVIYNYTRFDPLALVALLERVGVTTFCAPPTVWRMIASAQASSTALTLRECVAAGEPLNAEVIEQIHRSWGITVRDGFGQTETTAQIANPPGQLVKPGSMGRPLPGYQVALVDPATGLVGNDGELCLELARRPLALTSGYLDDPALSATATAGGFYHTGDLASRDKDGYLTYIGRSDDVFKSSDYRISPFELESVLIEHPAVLEAAVIPSPDAVRLAVPKAVIALAPGYAPTPELALDLLRFARSQLAPYKRIRRLEFAELPKTISSKIRRVELRRAEAEAVRTQRARPHAYSEDDFPELRTSRP